jgi:hypothetical protein
MANKKGFKNKTSVKKTKKKKKKGNNGDTSPSNGPRKFRR